MHGIWLLSYIFAWLIGVTQLLIVGGLFWAIGRIHLKSAPEAGVLMTDEGPHLNQKLPRFEVNDYKGITIRTDDFARSRWILLILSVGCAPCEDLLSKVQKVFGRVSSDAKILIVFEATPENTAKMVERYNINLPVISDFSGQLRESLRIDRTPYGIAIDELGYVRMKGVVNTGEQLEGLIFHRGRPISAGNQWEFVSTHTPTSDVMS